MNLIAFICFIFALQSVCFVIGSRSSKGMKSNNDYFLAGKNIPFFPLMMTFLATQVGGGLILGAAEEAYRYGWTVLLYPLGCVLGLIILGLGIGRKLAQFQVSTIAQIFEVAYRSPLLKRVASSLSIVSLFMIFVAQIIASRKFMLSLGVESDVCFIAFWAIVIAYTALGGLKAVVSTDVIQAAFFVIVFLFCFAYALGSSELSVPQIWEMGFDRTNFDFQASKWYGWLFMPLLFMFIEQDMGQRCFAANSPSTISKATIVAGIGTLIITIIPIFFGILAKSYALVIPEGSSVMMAVVANTTNPIVTALVGCAILAAIISTADSLINAIGSNLSQDFDIIASLRQNIRLPQMISTLIALFGVVFSFYFSNVVDLLIQSYELSVSCLFVPIAMALFRKQGNALPAALAISFGAACFVVCQFITFTIPKELLSVSLSLIGFLLGDLYERVSIRNLEKKAGLI